MMTLKKKESRFSEKLLYLVEFDSLFDSHNLICKNLLDIQDDIHRWPTAILLDTLHIDLSSVLYKFDNLNSNEYIHHDH